MNPRLEERLARGLMLASAGLVLGCLLLMLGTLLWKGLPAMSLAMVFSPPRAGFYLGGGGGVANAIVGSLLLAGGATALAACAAVPMALYLGALARRQSRLAALARGALDVLWGVPSIVYGAFGFTLLLALGLRASLLGGMLTVALLILPIMTRAMDEVLRMAPRDLADASSALGATRLETAFKVILRQTLPGFAGAVLLAFGRGIGDAASVLFTAGFSDRVPASLLDPAATLPLAIFFQLGTPFPEVRQRAYAAALILTVIILAVSLLGRALAGRAGRHVIR